MFIFLLFKHIGTFSSGKAQKDMKKNKRCPHCGCTVTLWSYKRGHGAGICSESKVNNTRGRG